MRVAHALTVAVGVFALAACGGERDEAAENVEENAEAQAENIVENAESVAENIVENAQNQAELVENLGEESAEAVRNGAGAEGNTGE